MRETEICLAEFHAAMMKLLGQKFDRDQVRLLVKLAEKFTEITENLEQRINGN